MNAKTGGSQVTIRSATTLMGKLLSSGLLALLLVSGIAACGQTSSPTSKAQPSTQTLGGQSTGTEQSCVRVSPVVSGQRGRAAHYVQCRPLP